MKRLFVAVAVSAAALFGGSAANAADNTVRAKAVPDVTPLSTDFSSRSRHYRHYGYGHYRHYGYRHYRHYGYRHYRPYYRSYGYAPRYYGGGYGGPYYGGGYGYGGPSVSFGFGGGGYRGW
ncbi:hypothetical protein FXV83_20965 [Bradyrhizobium hipponense]|uniref:Uncharacterized protein n=1 Tax=Bradyrhizobium hipponense TaxID=2605638 RepID=A0A5S4YJN2_9BRAD|nr:hypothetical protein [Bradyrhizobium hipponense]TYO64601.1 hypothetical protein FXV83_20965 [Bradyrhizobium hipponense]